MNGIAPNRGFIAINPQPMQYLDARVEFPIFCLPSKVSCNCFAGHGVQTTKQRPTSTTRNDFTAMQHNQQRFASFITTADASQPGFVTAQQPDNPLNGLVYSSRSKYVDSPTDMKSKPAGEVPKQSKLQKLQGQTAWKRVHPKSPERTARERVHPKLPERAARESARPKLLERAVRVRVRPKLPERTARERIRQKSLNRAARERARVAIIRQAMKELNQLIPKEYFSGNNTRHSQLDILRNAYRYIEDMDNLLTQDTISRIYSINNHYQR